MKNLYIKWQSELTKLYEEQKQLNNDLKLNIITYDEYIAKTNKLQGKIDTKLADIKDLKDECEKLKANILEEFI